MQPVDAHTRQWIIAHINDRPRTHVARRAGVSLSTIYRIARQQGAPMLTHLSQTSPRRIDIIRRCYPTMSSREIQQQYGIPSSRVRIIARRLGIQHTESTNWRLRHKAIAALSAARHKINTAERARKWKARRRIDELRVLEGKPQRTRFHFATITRRCCKAKHHLIRTYGYIASPHDAYTLHYDSHTRRRPPVPTASRTCGTEAYYTQKYHLIFTPLSQTLETYEPIRGI